MVAMMLKISAVFCDSCETLGLVLNMLKLNWCFMVTVPR